MGEKSLFHVFLANDGDDITGNRDLKLSRHFTIFDSILCEAI